MSGRISIPGDMYGKLFCTLPNPLGTLNTHWHWLCIREFILRGNNYKRSHHKELMSENTSYNTKYQKDRKVHDKVNMDMLIYSKVESRPKQTMGRMRNTQWNNMKPAAGTGKPKSIANNSN